MVNDNFMQRREIRGYLDELRAGLSGSNKTIREQVISEITNHIKDAADLDRRHGRTPNSAAILNELGDPLVIAAEAATAYDIESSNGSDANTRMHIFASSEDGRRVILLLMALGSYVFAGLGWVASLLLMWMSSHWNKTEKIIATTITPMAFLAMLAIPFGDIMFFVSPLMTFLWLLWRGHRRVTSRI